MLHQKKRNFIKDFFVNVGKTFMGRNFLWHILAIVLTYVFVVSGFDWWYFVIMRPLHAYLFPAAPMGFLLPVLIIFISLTYGVLRQRAYYAHSAAMFMQGIFVALAVTAFYKMITGRLHPDVFGTGPLVDISHEFHFGVLNEGVFWGWPSSHTAVACALAVLMWKIFPRSIATRSLGVLMALYIGVGVSATIHWFSDFIAGAILGILVGVIVSRHGALHTNA